MVEIRRLVEGDWPLLRRVRLAALRDAPEAFASTLDRESSLDERGWRGRLTEAATFVAVTAGEEPVGLVTGLPQEGADVHLVGMWVRPEMRGRGVAARLVSSLLDWSRRRSAPGVVLWVVADNERARRFYAGQGFAATGLRQLMPEKPSVPEEQWRLAL